VAVHELNGAIKQMDQITQQLRPWSNRRLARLSLRRKTNELSKFPFDLGAALPSMARSLGLRW
jgi:hypothetical protein